MFDCGMHMGYNDERRFPDFTLLSSTREFNEVIDCVIITHFHLDHCGALPYFTEMCGYDGPVIMTHPTKALCPILLEDYRKITVDRKGESNFFTSEHIKKSMQKVTALNVHESLCLAPDFEIRPYYAGHVLGAAMFYVRVGAQSVVYTGDYNMTPDRHLGAAWINQCEPDVLITESTYATTIRESKRGRERDFLKKVHQAVAMGGKVLIPVFALGRVQELCILIESYWERMGLGEIPIYFSAGMAETATEYYKQYLEWTNESIQRIATERQNPFDFKYIKPFERHLADIPGPMVLFSTPGMLHSGTSLEVFKKWAPNPKNMVIIPGYCVAGTVGAKVLAGATSIDIDGKTTVPVNLQVKNLSFSAHADAKGILQLIKNCKPRNVVLVHGDPSKMSLLKDLIKRQFNLPCFMPANGEMICVKDSGMIPARLERRLLDERLEEIERYAMGVLSDPDLKESEKKRLLMNSAKIRSRGIEFNAVLSWSEQNKQAGLPPSLIRQSPHDPLLSKELTITVDPQALVAGIRKEFALDCIPVSVDETHIKVRSVCLSSSSNGYMLEWSCVDESVSNRIIKCLNKMAG